MTIVGSKYKKTIQRSLNVIGKNEHKEIPWVRDSFARKTIENCWFRLKSRTIPLQSTTWHWSKSGQL
jgi:hypothetical protein